MTRQFHDPETDPAGELGEFFETVMEIRDAILMVLGEMKRRGVPAEHRAQRALLQGLRAVSQVLRDCSADIDRALAEYGSGAS